ncbi:MAG: hypothetical protein P4N59_03505 [Negativicutes bacterium]|nr:hypothetical protein [Negativicutes bacterium]
MNRRWKQLFDAAHLMGYRKWVEDNRVIVGGNKALKKFILFHPDGTIEQTANW